MHIAHNKYGNIDLQIQMVYLYLSMETLMFYILFLWMLLFPIFQPIVLKNQLYWNEIYQGKEFST